MEKENDEYLKTIKLKVTKCKITQNYKSSFTVFWSFCRMTQLLQAIQKRKTKFKPVFQSDAKTKNKKQNSNLFFNAMRKRKTKNGNAI